MPVVLVTGLTPEVTVSSVTLSSVLVPIRGDDDQTEWGLGSLVPKQYQYTGNMVTHPSTNRAQCQATY